MIFITNWKFNETLFYGRDYSELARKFENSSKLCFLIFTPVRFCCNSLQLLGRNQRQSLKLTWDLIIATFIIENCSNFPIFISESFNNFGEVNPPAHKHKSGVEKREILSHCTENENSSNRLFSKNVIFTRFLPEVRKTHWTVEKWKICLTETIFRQIKSTQVFILNFSNFKHVIFTKFLQKCMTHCEKSKIWVIWV